MDLNWTAQLPEQLTWWWDHHTRPHLTGLSDEEYFWEPAPAMWSIRPRAEARTATPALHINREVLHHLAVLLLRDLYAAQHH